MHCVSVRARMYRTMLCCMCAVRRSPVAGLAFVATGVYSTVIYTLDAFPSITFPATQKYDTQSDSWVCTTRIPTLRMTESSSYGAFAAALGDKIHVIAGGDIRETKTKNEVYSPVTDSWTSKVSVPTEYNGGFVIAAGAQSFANGVQYDLEGKGNTYYVRAVRAF